MVRLGFFWYFGFLIAGVWNLIVVTALWFIGAGSQVMKKKNEKIN